MRTIFGVCVITLNIFCTSVFADTIYIVGTHTGSTPVYWTISPPDAVSGANDLDIVPNAGGTAFGVAFSSTPTVYIVGSVQLDEDAGAAYWTVLPPNTASSLNNLGAVSGSFATAASVVFNPSGVGYIVGIASSGNAAYWTVSASGSVSAPNELTAGGGATGVAFSSLGNGYIVGLDGDGNACYWTISNTGVVTGPTSLVGGETGGTGNAYAVAFSPSNTAYIVGSTTASAGCYWTISPLGVASAANELDSASSNSSGRGVAFLPSGAGMIVGQAPGNLSAYWNISSGGSVGTVNALPNGSGGGSSAYGVAFSSDQTAYIVGVDNASQGVYWTVPLAGSPIGYELLTSRDNGVGLAIAIQTLVPPTGLSAKYVTNDFALLYEYCAVLNWTLSQSSGVASYNIYKNGIRVGTVNGSTNQYQNHDQDPSSSSVYTVTAVDGSGNESSPATVTLN